MSSTAGARWLAQQHHEAGAAPTPAEPAHYQPPRASDRWPLADCMSERAFQRWVGVLAEFGMLHGESLASSGPSRRPPGRGNPFALFC